MKTEKIELKSIHMDLNDVDTLARDLLYKELANIDITDPLIIWHDEKSAYLDDASKETYAKLAVYYREHKDELGVHADVCEDNEAFVDAALFTRYEIICSAIHDELKEQTMEIRSLDPDTRLLFWLSPFGYCGCLKRDDGTESDDRGPFNNPYDIERSLRELHASGRAW